MNRIRELREQKGLQQKELAVDLGISQPTVSDWEAGRKVPSAKSTMKLSKYFGVSVEYLMGEEEQRFPVSNGSPDELTEVLYRRPGMRILFDAAKDAPDEVLQKTADLLEAMKNGKIQ